MPPLMDATLSVHVPAVTVPEKEPDVPVIDFTLTDPENEAVVMPVSAPPVIVPVVSVNVFAVTILAPVIEPLVIVVVPSVTVGEDRVFNPESTPPLSVVVPSVNDLALTTDENDALTALVMCPPFNET